MSRKAYERRLEEVSKICMSPTAVVNYVNKAVQDAFKRGVQVNSNDQPSDDVAISLKSTGGIGRTKFSDDFLATVYAKEQGFKL